MALNDVTGMVKPDSDSQYRLKKCDCGSSEVVYLSCDDPYGGLAWRLKCMDCGNETQCSYYMNRHDAQIDWNKGLRAIKL